MKYNYLVVAMLSSAVLSACGGSSGTSTPAPEVTADTALLKSNAASAIGGNFDANVTAAGSVLNTNSEVLVGTVGDVVVGGTEEFPEDIETETTIQSNVQDLMFASLSASEGSEGVTTHTGNTIRVDPDENELCNDETLFGGQTDTEFEFLTDESEAANCRELAKDLIVELIVSGEESGEVNYLFRNSSVLKLGYAPGFESIELNLGGLNTLSSAYNDIYSGGQADPADAPEVMVGSVKFAATTSNAAVGQEAGSVSMDIVSPVSIVVDDGSGKQSMDMATGTLFAISADAGTGQGSLSFDVGAIAGVFRDGSSLAKMNLAGFTGKADVNPDNGTLVVSNLGMSRGPFSVSVDNEDVLKVTLESFGFQVNEQSGQITIDGNMNLSLLLAGIGIEDSGLTSSMINLMAPSGTAFSRAGNGSLQIGGTGPFSISANATNTEGEFSESIVTVNAGECIDDISDELADAPSAERCL